MAPRSDVDTDLDALLAAAAVAKTPIPAPPVNPRKRPRTGNADDSQEEDEDDELPTSVIPATANEDPVANKNVLAFARQYATHKRLRPSLIDEVEAYAAVRHFISRCSPILTSTYCQDPIATRQIKMFTVLLSLDTKMEAFRSAAPDFKITSNLDVRPSVVQPGIGILLLASQKNMHSLALGVLASPKLAAYKGNIATKHILVRPLSRYLIPPVITCPDEM